MVRVQPEEPALSIKSMTYVRASSTVVQVPAFQSFTTAWAALDDVPQLLSNEHPVIEETLRPPAPHRSFGAYWEHLTAAMSLNGSLE